MWSTQQQSMLNVMGYTLYVRPGSRAIEVKADLAQMQTAAPTSSSDSALFKAIMKVVQGRNISQLGIDINALRGSPQAKRALWPHLRQVMKF